MLFWGTIDDSSVLAELQHSTNFTALISQKNQVSNNERTRALNTNTPHQETMKRWDPYYDTAYFQHNRLNLLFDVMSSLSDIITCLIPGINASLDKIAAFIKFKPAAYENENNYSPSDGKVNLCVNRSIAGAK